VQSKSYHEVRNRGRVAGREVATHIDISHGDARHDCRYVNWYLRSGGVILRSSGRKVWCLLRRKLIDLEGHCHKIGAARRLRQDFSPNGAKSAFGSCYSFFLRLMPKNSSFISTLSRTASTVDKALSDGGVEDRGSKLDDRILKPAPLASCQHPNGRLSQLRGHSS